MEEAKLKELVDSYGVNKGQADNLKKVLDEQNSTIKTAMKELGKDKIETDDYKASYVEKEVTKVDEDRVYLYLQESDYEKFLALGVIKVKEYIDTKELESAIYSGALDKDLLSKIRSCYTVNHVPTLTVKKKGK